MEERVLDENKICFIVYTDVFDKYSDSSQIYIQI